MSFAFSRWLPLYCGRTLPPYSQLHKPIRDDTAYVEV